MSIPTDPAKIARAVVRHVRNSHAIGKLVVDTAVRGVTTKFGPPTRASSEPNRASSVDAANEAAASTTQAEPYEGLPLPVAQWALLSSGDVVDMVSGCDDATVRVIGAYEEAHRRRRLVIQAVKNRLGQ
jgi:hypothetical protein